MIVEILHLVTPPADQSFHGEGVWGEGIYTVPTKPIEESEVIQLVRFVQPHAQSITVAWRVGGIGEEWLDTETYWGQISW